MTKLEAFILVGGRSSRLGTDKAFVELAGKTLVERAVGVVRRGLSLERITIVAGNAAQFGVQAIVAGQPFIFDLYEDRGPIGGVHAALANARKPWIFVLACDYPFVTPEFVRALGEKISDEFGAIVPEQKDGRLQPLCAFYNVRRALPIVDQILQQPRPSLPMHEVAAKLDPRIVRYAEYRHLVGASDPFININTLQDLESAKQNERELADRDHGDPDLP